MNYNDLCPDRVGLDEHNDCGVVAVSMATKVPYREVRKLFGELGRRPGCGTYPHQERTAFERLGFRLVPIEFGATTIEGLELELQLRHKDSSFFIHTRRHCVSFADGQIKDWTAGRRHRPKAVYKVTPLVRCGTEPTETAVVKESIASAILAGKHDRELVEIESAIKARLNLGHSKKLFSLEAGMSVVFNEKTKPLYLIGVTGKVVRLKQKNVVVDIGRRINRFGPAITTPPSLIDVIEE